MVTYKLSESVIEREAEVGPYIDKYADLFELIA